MWTSTSPPEKNSTRLNGILFKYNLYIIYSRTLQTLLLWVMVVSLCFFFHCLLTSTSLENVVDAEVSSSDLLWGKTSCPAAGQLSALGIPSAAESPQAPTHVPTLPSVVRITLLMKGGIWMLRSVSPMWQVWEAILAPGSPVGSAEAVIQSASPPDFSLYPILLMSPSFHRCSSKCTHCTGR